VRWRRRPISTHRGNAIRASEHGTSKGDAAVDCDRDPDSIIAGAGSKENCDALHVFVGANPASGLRECKERGCVFAKRDARCDII